ncbi:MAG TPA: hypothetical protein VM327_01080 [Candidatus Thermoplasmatota archaeon]|nr:hypothetical protein [Candidatus Thermoplasmatota archaeon]
MRTGLVIAIALAFASFLLAVAFGVLTAVCGRMQASPGHEASCVSSFYPLVPVWAGFAVLGGAGLWFRKAWPAVTLGTVGLALGVVTGLSSGFFGIGCGALLLAAGLAGRPSKGPADGSGA